MPLVPSHIRLMPQSEESPSFDSEDVAIENEDESDGKTYDDKGNVITIEFPRRINLIITGRIPAGKRG